MLHPHPRYTHEENRHWHCLSLLVPAEESSCDGFYWYFDWDPYFSERKYLGKKWKLVTKPVKEIPLATQEQTAAAQLPPLWRRHYSHFMDLVRALAGNPKMIEALVPPSADADYQKTVSKNPQALVSAHFDEAVTYVKFVMWRKNGAEKLIPGLLLAVEEMVPFALAAYNSVNPKGQRICERKSCGKEFVPTFNSANREQRFCSYLCRKAVQEQRRRDRKRKRDGKRKSKG